MVKRMNRTYFLILQLSIQMLYNWDLNGLFMNTQKRIEEEKLANILNPKKSNREFKITLRFQKHLTKNYEKAVALAKQNPGFMEEGRGEFYKIYVSFYPDEVENLYRIFELVKDQDTTKIYLNNKLVPYIQDLWLFLMWFHRIK